MGSPGIVVRTKGILVVGSGDQQVWIQPTTLLSDVTAAEPEEKDAAYLKLAKMGRNASKVRIRHRCMLTGRSRGNYRRFGICRNKFRELALLGQIPGVRKASW